MTSSISFLLLPIQVRTHEVFNQYGICLTTYHSFNYSYMSFCKFLSLLAYPSKRLKTYAAIRSTAGIDNQFGQGMCADVVAYILIGVWILRSTSITLPYLRLQ